MTSSTFPTPRCAHKPCTCKLPFRGIQTNFSSARCNFSNAHSIYEHKAREMQPMFWIIWMLSNENWDRTTSVDFMDTRDLMRTEFSISIMYELISSSFLSEALPTSSAVGLNSIVYYFLMRCSRQFKDYIVYFKSVFPCYYFWTVSSPYFLN